MKPKRFLFISGSVGLGHVTRDLAMARALRRTVPGVEVDWLAASPGSEFLKEAGEHLLPEAVDWADESAVGAKLAGRDAARGRPFQFNVLRSFFSNKRQHRRNVEIFREVVATRAFDLIIGDEAYEIAMALREGEVRTPIAFVMIYDFIGVDPVTRNPLEHIGAYLTNRRWAYGYRRAPDVPITTCYIGEAEDIPDRSFGPGLPSRRRWAQERCHILGYVLPFDATSCQDKPTMRRKLGYGEEPLVVCTVGGSGIGLELLGLCLECYPLLKKRIQNLRMVMVGGPRVDLTKTGDIPGPEMRGYVPALFEHFAASDLVVTQGGGTSTLELTALRRPFLYFPLEGHFEQEVHVTRRLERHGAGIRMRFSETSPHDLADMIATHVGTEVTYKAIPVGGAQRLADVAKDLIGATSKEIA